MSGGPVRAVLDAVESGCITSIDIERRTGLPADLVETALEQLARMGRLRPSGAADVCSPRGCGGCPSADASCAVGPVLVGLSRR